MILRRIKQALPNRMQAWIDIQREGLAYWPPSRQVDLGDLRRTTPVSREFGFDRGLPIDRYYIENFLTANRDDIHGRVLEIGDDSYTKQFGGSQVTQRDVLHVVKGNPIATFVGDLAEGNNIPDSIFDCFIFTQTLHLIYDWPAALKTIYRILKPGGVVLATFPGISQVSNDQWAEGWYWSFTQATARRMFGQEFPTDHIQVQTVGNRVAATAFLQGLAVSEVTRQELDHHDPDCEMLIMLRAMKPETAV